MRRTLIFAFFLCSAFLGCGEPKKEVVYVPVPQETSKGFGIATQNPLSMPNPSPRELPKGIEKLDEYYKHLVFANRYLEEGDYAEALSEIETADKYRKGEDPLFYELKGKIYDAIGDTDKAFKFLKKAAWLYYERGNYDKAWILLGWLNSLKPDDPEVKKLEKRLREEEI
jgi:tetratricopeptide (TPR) repeat protein